MLSADVRGLGGGDLFRAIGMRVRVPQHRLLRCNDVRRSEAAADVHHAHLLCGSAQRRLQTADSGPGGGLGGGGLSGGALRLGLATKSVVAADTAAGVVTADAEV